MQEPIDVLDLFSGCGGLSLGFAQFENGKRFRIIGGVDTDQNACRTFEDQLGAPALNVDVRELMENVDDSGFLSNFKPRSGGPLVVVGGPPCQGFSAHRKKDPRLDERNDLVDVFFEIAISLRPEFIVMENVPEVFDDRHWPATERTIERVEAAGYRVRAQIHNLADFGVPQARFRAIIIARRAGRAFNFPEKSHEVHRTVRDAIGGLPEIRSGHRCPSDEMHIAPKHTQRILELIASIPKDGGSRRNGDLKLLPNCHGTVDGFRDVYGRLAWDKPSISITAKSSTPSCGRFLHPEQNRNISVREAALLQGFPKWFKFSGPLVQMYRQIGNAVSPIFSSAIAKKIAEEMEQPTFVVRDTYKDIQFPQGRSFTSSIASRKRQAPSKVVQDYQPKAIDLFAGAGGLSLGLIRSEYDIRYALDADPDAVRTYAYNIGDHIFEASAFDVSADQILAGSGLEIGECDLLVGGPPCQGFSQQRRGSDEDIRNDLVLWFGNMIAQIQPRAFLLENVPYIAAKRGKVILSEFMKIVQASGYLVQSALVDASNFGVPQKRQRFIAVGFAPGLGEGYSIPLGSDDGRKNIRDAIGLFPSPNTKKEHPDFANHIGSLISELNRKRISFVPEGGGWQDIPVELQLDCHKNHRGHGRLDVFGRLRWDGLATTITAHSDSFSRGRYAHPSEDRPLSGRELAALQSFPNWYRFLADKKSVARLVGNAVPPQLAKVLVSSIRAELLKPENLRKKIRKVS